MMSPPASDPWLPYRKSVMRPPRLRLFCFPFAGAGASIFRGWNGCFSPAVEVCAVQLPGREGRITEPPFRSAGALLPALLDALHPHLDIPFVLFGHSLGAAISFELAQALRREKGPSPEAVVACARRAPGLAPEKPPIHALPDREFKEELRQLKGTPEEVLQHPELMTFLLPLLRADFELNDTYVPSTTRLLDCPLVVFGGLQDDEVQPRQLEAWRSLAGGRFLLKMLPGDHFSLLASDGPLVAAMRHELQAIASAL